jgi:4-hydroxy-tetrahydrodipicolinate reductase
LIRILVFGLAGRMGQALRRLVEDADDLRLVGGIEREPRRGEAAARLGCEAVVTAEDAGELISASDAVLDFSSPAALRQLLERSAEQLAGRALIVGTTGLAAREQELVAEAAHRSPVIVSANFSIGLNLLLELVQQAARVLAADRFDSEIVELHHRRKADAPSGTALALAAAIAAARKAPLETVRRDGRSGEIGPRPTGEIGLHALRGGAVVGEHRVHFLGTAERLELAHVATDRALFAEGALLAARWAAGRPPGRYELREVLGL